MAQEVAWMEEDVVYTDGPFVICNPMGGGWRIEAERKGRNFSSVPHDSISALVRKIGFDGTTDKRSEAAIVCDVLNALVEAGKIKLDHRGTSWRYVESISS